MKPKEAPDVVGSEAHGLLHGYQSEDLSEVVLHDVADDAEVIEVPAAALCAEGLLRM